MNLNVLPEFLRFVIGINHEASATEILSTSSLLRVKPDISDRIPSGRSFEAASLVCAELELEPEETVVAGEIATAAQALGWQIADVRETAEFIRKIAPGYKNYMPESLLSDFQPNGKSAEESTSVLRFERRGFDDDVTFSLTVEDVELLRGQQHVLLIRKYVTEE